MSIKRHIHVEQIIIIKFFIVPALALNESPRITEHPLNMTVARNEPVTLSCKANGTPRPTIEWYRNGQLVKMAPEDPVSHRILLPDGSLFFLKAMQSKKEQDGGTYWCVASNEIGVARSNNATLEIACKFSDFYWVVYLESFVLGWGEFSAAKPFINLIWHKRECKSRKKCRWWWFPRSWR